jgi:hypothetical protein
MKILIIIQKTLKHLYSRKLSLKFPFFDAILQEAIAIEISIDILSNLSTVKINVHLLISKGFMFQNYEIIAHLYFLPKFSTKRSKHKELRKRYRNFRICFLLSPPLKFIIFHQEKSIPNSKSD